jgi:hypothetical protein
LNRQLGNAEEADRQRTARSLAEVTGRVASTERAIANFDKALITELRESMSDEEVAPALEALQPGDPETAGGERRC